QWISMPLAAIGILLNGLSPLLLCRAHFRHISRSEKLAALLMWPFMGAAVSIAAACGYASIRARQLHNGLRRTVQLARLGWRALARNGMPVALIHFITARCNLRCEHCFYKETLDAKDPGEQSLAQLDKTTREAGPLLW